MRFFVEAALAVGCGVAFGMFTDMSKRKRIASRPKSYLDGKPTSIDALVEVFAKAIAERKLSQSLDSHRN